MLWLSFAPLGRLSRAHQQDGNSEGQIESHIPWAHPAHPARQLET